ncbi:hypothetical protein ACTA71_006945 [Dictyostelium dimigraforme]
MYTEFRNLYQSNTVLLSWDDFSCFSFLSSINLYNSSVVSDFLYNPILSIQNLIKFQYHLYQGLTLNGLINSFVPKASYLKNANIMNGGSIILDTQGDQSNSLLRSISIITKFINIFGYIILISNSNLEEIMIGQNTQLGPVKQRYDLFGFKNLTKLEITRNFNIASGNFSFSDIKVSNLLKGNNFTNFITTRDCGYSQISIYSIEFKYELFIIYGKNIGYYTNIVSIPALNFNKKNLDGSISAVQHQNPTIGDVIQNNNTFTFNGTYFSYDQCQCLTGYTGLDCQPLPKNENLPESTTIIDPSSGSTNISNEQTVFQISINSVVEVDFNGNEISNSQIYLSNNWKLESGVKLSFSISNWNYQKVNTCNDDDNDGESSFESLSLSSNNQSDHLNLNYLKFTINGKTLQGRFQDKMLSDGRSTITLSKVLSKTNNMVVIGLELPHCIQCLPDPDFSVILSPNFETLDSCKSLNDNRKPWLIPVVFVVPIIVFPLELLFQK